MISVSEKFFQIANGSVRPLDWACNISFTKDKTSDATWFTLNQSVLDGSDLLNLADDQPIQLWDFYEYGKYKDRLMSASISRSIQFPYNVQSAIADFTLENHDGMFTFDGDSELSDYILPSRPVRLYFGFKGAEVIPQFVGLTEGIPKYEGINNTKASFTAMDFLSSIANMTLGSTIMLRDARTDEAIAMILDQFGLDSRMYDLDPGANVIPFLVLEKGRNAGNVLNELVLAENGKLWLNETGVIRFSPRVSDLGKQPVAMFDASNILEYKPSAVDGIYNRVKIKSDIRAIQVNQPIFSISNEKGYDSSEDQYRVKGNGQNIFWLNFDDPIWSANQNPVLNGDNTTSNFTALNMSGDTVSSGVTAHGELFADSMKLTVVNSNSYPISISFLQIWGEPAKVVDTIDYDAYDDESVDKFGERLLEITDNNYFGSYENVDSFASSILNNKAKYSPNCTIKVKGNPALQIDDVVHLSYKGDQDYKIVGITEKLSTKGLTTELKLERYEVVEAFTLDVSVLNGEDRLG